MNGFDSASQPEVLFIAYDDVIRSLKYGVIKRLLQPEIRKLYIDKIDYSTLDNKEDGEILALILSSEYKDILHRFAKTEFDYWREYISITINYPDLIQNSPLMTFANAIRILLMQKFVEKIYIYFRYNDDRVYNDLKNLYQTHYQKLVYVTGELTNVLNDISDNITMFVFNDIDMINDVIDCNKIKNSQILIGEYGYNYTVNENQYPLLKIADDEKFQKEYHCVLRTFSPTSYAKFS